MNLQDAFSDIEPIPEEPWMAGLRPMSVKIGSRPSGFLSCQRRL